MLARSLLTFSRTLVLSFLSSQATGKLHVYLDTQQGGKVATVSARDGLLKGSPTPDSVTYSIVPLDANPIDASRFVVNKTETIGIVAGKTLGDADTLAVRVLYLGKRDVANREVPSVDLDPALFGSFPGLDILDLQFHPDSEQHVVVLTSDRTLRVYDVEESRCGLPAEQTFELRGRKRVFLGDGDGDDDDDDDDDDDEEGLDGVLRDPVPVSFAFGGSSGGRDGGKTASPSTSTSLSSASAWSRLAVLVLMSDGEVRPLCPVAPFGARYSGRFVASLLPEDDDVGLGAGGRHAESRDLARIWAFKAFGVDDCRNVERKRRYVVAPHALESHVARFPEWGVRIRSNGTGDASTSVTEFRGIHTWPIAPSAVGILETSTGGRVRAGVLLGDVVPAWTLNPPQCVFHGEDIVAVRSQCVQPKIFAPSGQDGASLGNSTSHARNANANLNHVIIDDIALDDEHITGVFRDPANPTSFVVAQQLAAHVVSLPWISALDGELPDALPLATVTELMRAEPASPVVCHALLGDKLSGSALFSILSDGTQVVHRIVNRVGLIGAADDAYGANGAYGADGADDANDANGGKAPDVGDAGKKAGTVTTAANASLLASHVKEMYTPIMSAPDMRRRTFAAAEAAESPDNLGAFVESVSDLRSQHVAFCHKAHHTIRQRVQQLEDEVLDQLSRVKEITSLLHRVDKKQSELKYLEEKTKWMAGNVADRVQLLGELYWAAPKPKSDEEKRFQHIELPLLESSTAVLETEVNLLRSMASRLSGSVRGGAQAGGSAAAAARMGTRMGDLRHIREKLEDHQEAIRRECGRLQVIEKAIAGS